MLIAILLRSTSSMEAGWLSRTTAFTTMYIRSLAGVTRFRLAESCSEESHDAMAHTWPPNPKNYSCHGNGTDLQLKIIITTQEFVKARQHQQSPDQMGVKKRKLVWQGVKLRYQIIKNLDIKLSNSTVICMSYYITELQGSISEISFSPTMYRDIQWVEWSA